MNFIKIHDIKISHPIIPYRVANERETTFCSDVSPADLFYQLIHNAYDLVSECRVSADFAFDVGNTLEYSGMAAIELVAYIFQ
jgi:hypothetical protein